MILTPEQQGAVRRRGQDVCVVAGPGSGKTTVLVERYAWLIAEAGLRPDEILAITFTEKAANEIKQRLAARFVSDAELRHQIERAPVSTIHGFCARLLRRHAIAAGLDPQFEILDENAQRTELAAAIRESLDHLARHRVTDLRRLLTAWKTDDPEHALTDLFDRWRTAGGTAADLRRMPAAEAPPDLAAAGGKVLRVAPFKLSPGLATRLAEHRSWLAAFAALPEGDTAAAFDLAATWEFKLTGQRDEGLKTAVREFGAALAAWEISLLARHTAPARRVLVDAFLAAVKGYDERKRALNALDFNDLESEVIRLARLHPQMAARLRGEFKAVLMDELQDTNPQQWRLVDLIRPKNGFFAVGDINQSIFGFRHAEPRVFAGYRDALAGRRRPIDYLRANNRTRWEILRAVETMFEGAAGIEEPRFTPRFEFVGPEDDPVEYWRIEMDDRDRAEEAEAAWIARRVREIGRYAETAILVRNSGGLELLEQALRDAGVPFVMNRGRQFFEEQEVRDLLNWLRVIDNPCNELAVLAVLRSPLFCAGDEEIFEVNSQGGRLCDLLAETLAPYRRQRDEWPPDRLIAQRLDETGYLTRLTESARANVGKLLAMVREAHARRPRPLAELLEAFDRLRELGGEPNAPLHDSVGAVEVMTIHGSKGLEWPVVVVASLHRGGNTRNPEVTFSPENGLGVTWRHPVTNKSAPDQPHARNLAALREREAEEAHRLFYVATTRAAEKLVLTSVATRSGRVDWPELAERAVPARVVTGPPPRFDLPAPVRAEAADLLLLRRPEVTDNWQSAVSITELAAFAENPEAARTAVAAPADPAVAGPGFGTLVHAVLAGEAVGDAGAEALAAQFTRSPWGERAARAARVEREWDFLYELEGVVLRGQIDLWFEDEAGAVVVDYKTDRRPGAQHDWQMRFYRLAVERVLGRPVEAVVFFLREGLARAVPGDEAGCRALVRRWKAQPTSA